MESEPKAVEIIVGTLLAAFLGLLGWHGRRVSWDVESLKARTTRLEAIAVNLEDIRKVLREEVGIHIRESERRTERVEVALEKLNDRIHDVQQCLPRRHGDAVPPP